MNKNLGFSKKQFETIKKEFSESEKIDIIKSVIYGTLLGKRVGQVIEETACKNDYLINRNYKKLNEVLREDKHLITIAFKEVLKEKLNLNASCGGAI